MNRFVEKNNFDYLSSALIFNTVDMKRKIKVDDKLHIKMCKTNNWRIKLEARPIQHKAYKSNWNLW